jgi:hypothetical protein
LCHPQPIYPNCTLFGSATVPPPRAARSGAPCAPRQFGLLWIRWRTLKPTDPCDNHTPGPPKRRLGELNLLCLGGVSLDSPQSNQALASLSMQYGLLAVIHQYRSVG